MNLPASFRLSPRGVLALLAVVVSLGIGSRAFAQTPSLTALYYQLDPKDTFKYKWKGDSKVCNVGAFRWYVPESEFSTGGLDRNFTGYCAEIDITITADILYRFRPISLYDPKNYGLEETPEGILAAQRRATLIRELYGRYYTENKTARPEETFAFQVALWELTHESEPMDKAATFDLYAGEFQVNYPREASPEFVLLAQEYLNSLTGDDSIYYQNPNINGRELIRLDGLPNAEGIVAQAQYALRYITGGAAGVGPFVGYPAGGAGGALGAIGAGGGIAGIGGVAGAGGPGGGGPLIGTTGTGGTGGTGGTPPGGGSRPPGGGPSNSPVPAPAGLFLGLAAVGAFATRRIVLRLGSR